MGPSPGTAETHGRSSRKKNCGGATGCISVPITEQQERSTWVLGEAYYDDPRISSAQASALLHELIALLAINGGSANKSLVNTVVRLLPFFSMASQGGHEIRTQSD